MVQLRGRRGPPSKFTETELRAALDEGLSDEAAAERFGCSLALVKAKRRLLGIMRYKTGPRVMRARSRFKSKPVAKGATMPPVDHPALAEAHTIYPASVHEVEGLDRLLIDGKNSWKIGDRITKGALKGFPIYTLTLEERATCPDSCRHWRSCYGNHMNWARRIKHGPEFEERLGHELAIMQSRHPKGFAVRLHVLGDFYSPDYVRLWAGFLGKFKTLFVFGFTARIDEHDEISAALRTVVAQYPTRFAIRFSNSPERRMSTVSVEHPRQVPKDAILCPQQVGKTQSCGTCALCWQSTRPIAFLHH